MSKKITKVANTQTEMKLYETKCTQTDKLRIPHSYTQTIASIEQKAVLAETSISLPTPQIATSSMTYSNVDLKQCNLLLTMLFPHPCEFDQMNHPEKQI